MVADKLRRLISYLGDEKLTQQAFDEEGYYKTGDLAELKDGQYIFGGRANSDCTKSFTWKPFHGKREKAYADVNCSHHLSLFQDSGTPSGKQSARSPLRL